jgi:hypothetical protein
VAAAIEGKGQTENWNRNEHLMILDDI